MGQADASARKIIIPTDFSDASYTAFPYAKAQAQVSGMQVEVINVLSSIIVPSVMFEYLPRPEDIDRIRQGMKQQAEKKLKEIVKQNFGEMPALLTVIEAIGSAAEVILERARQQDCGLIVMATHGHGLLGRIALGSVAERVLRHATCPVLVVPCRPESIGKAPAHLPCRKILVTTDFSPAAEAALAVAGNQVRITGAKLTLGHVIENPLPPELFDAQFLTYAPEVQQVFKHYQAGYESRLKKLAQSMDGVEASPILVDKTYSVPNSISEYARQAQIDLIVLGAKGAGNRLNLIGGVAERIVRQAPCPVLVVP